MKIIITESKLINLFKQRYGFDFSGHVKKIFDHKDLPERFRWFSKKFFDFYLNIIPGEISPFYLISVDNKQYLYHFSNPTKDISDMVDDDMIDERGRTVNIDDFKKSNNVPNIGLSLKDIFDMYIDKPNDDVV
jgi:hypothetical protein